MNEFGEPNMGKPSVRFDEGRSDSAGLTTAVSSKPPPATSPTLLSKGKKIKFYHTTWQNRTAAASHPRADCVQQNVHIGENVVIGPGAVIVEDIADGQVVPGVQHNLAGQNRTKSKSV